MMAENRIAEWLPADLKDSESDVYQHTLFVEAPANWDQVRALVREYFRAAHADAIEHQRNLHSETLHPAGTPVRAPIDEYPWSLPQVTLQGYFGEVLVGMLVEHAGSGGHSDWEVPAYLFRFHKTAFQQLEQRWQTGKQLKAIPGRTGDDCLAFRRAADGRIIAVSFCEAKCTTKHDAGLIADAHTNAATSAIVDIPQLIEILRDKDTKDANEWIAALHVLLSALRTQSDSVIRCDVVCYVHGQSPKQSKYGDCWINPAAPHAKYDSDRRLDTFEVRLADVTGRLDSVYSRKHWE